MPACGSPWLFAACCVLRRLLAPRHPPYALITLTSLLHSPSAELMQPTLFSMLPLLCSCQGTSERKKISVGGDKEDRTPDLLLARQALSQLSYAPTNKLVGLDGLEPSTSRLSGVRSNQLSYRPACALIFLVPSKPNKDSARVSCGRGQFSSGSP